VRTIRRLIIHHSAGDPDQPVEEIRAFHTRPVSEGGRGWSDVAYHALIDGDGVMHVGRPLWIAGAHDEGENADSIGLCILGDNTKPGLGWRPAQIRAGIAYIKAVQILFPEIRVLGHRDEGPGGPGTTDPTACPGCDVHEVLLG
jgi:hypothetical protein